MGSWENLMSDSFPVPTYLFFKGDDARRSSQNRLRSDWERVWSNVLKIEVPKQKQTLNILLNSLT